MKRVLIFLFLIILFISPLAADASPGKPSFFESIFEWVGDVFTFGEIEKIERHIGKAEAILGDLERLKERGEDEEVLIDAARRYMKRTEKAREHLDRAIEKGLGIPRAAWEFFATSTRQAEILGDISLDLLEATEDLQEEVAKLLNEIDEELEDQEDLEDQGDFENEEGLDDSSEAEESFVACIQIYDPVCGADGKTYSNSCVAEHEHEVKIAYKGECKAEKALCPKEYVPVCGTDGKTYGNRCLAKEVSVGVLYDGGCIPPKPPEPKDTSDPDSSHNLSMKSISHYGTALLAGQIMNLSGVVLNSGKEGIEYETHARLYIDKGNDGTQDLIMAEYPVSPLKVGAEETIIWKSAFILEAGTHTAKICADTKNTVVEFDEKNNCASVTFTVKEKILLPDLIIQASPVFEPLSPKAGELMSFSAVIKNKGEGSSDGVYMVIYIDLGNDKTIDFDFENKRTSMLLSQAAEKVSWGGVWTAIQGVHRAEFCADSELEVHEQDESNNCSSMIFEVAAPQTY